MDACVPAAWLTTDEVYGASAPSTMAGSAAAPLMSQRRGNPTAVLALSRTDRKFGMMSALEFHVIFLP